MFLEDLMKRANVEVSMPDLEKYLAGRPARHTFGSWVQRFNRRAHS